LSRYHWYVISLTAVAGALLIIVYACPAGAVLTCARALFPAASSPAAVSKIPVAFLMFFMIIMCFLPQVPNKRLNKI